MINLGGAMISRSADAANPFTKILKTVGFSTYYLVAKKNRIQ